MKGLKHIIVSLMISIGLSSCTTVEYVTPSLPDFSISVPERPFLKNVEESVSDEVTDNLIALIDYAEKLEIVIDGWEDFYKGLREVQNEFSIR